MEGLVGLGLEVLKFSALLVVGYNLRTSGIFKASDAKSAITVASCLTLPSTILQSFNRPDLLSPGATAGVAAALAITVIVTGFNWLRAEFRTKRERAVLTGCSSSFCLAPLGYPFMQAIWGVQGMQAAALVGAVAALAECCLSYLMFASAGPAFPASYTHDDGGTYRGEWKGLKKEGLGIYSYPGGGRYEGEWRDNVKSGRGVYYFPKGGTYEGEWLNGAMTGVGVRTLSSGQVKAGQWRDNQLETPLEMWQCATAAEGATEAALAARRVQVGGGQPADTLPALLTNIPLWATAIGLVLAISKAPLPPALDTITGVLAPVNGPLMLLCAGMLMTVERPQNLMVLDISSVLCSRVVAGLVVGAVALLWVVITLPSLLPSTWRWLGGGEGVLVPIMAAVVMALSPVAAVAEQNAHHFRLNEALTSAIQRISTLVSLLFLMLLAVGSHVAAVTPSGAPLGSSSCISVVVVLLALAALTMAAATYLEDKYRREPKVAMIYRGPGVAGNPAVEGPSSPSLPSPPTDQQPPTGGSSSGPGPPGDTRGTPGPGGAPAAIPPHRCHAAEGCLQGRIHLYLQPRKDIPVTSRQWTRHWRWPRIATTRSNVRVLCRQAPPASSVCSRVGHCMM